MKTLGVTIDNNNNSKTIKMINTINGNDTSENRTRFLDRYRLRVNGENKCSPYVYWLTILHKNPTKALFLITTSTCFLQPLSVVFKILFYQTERYQHFFYNFGQSATHIGYWYHTQTNHSWFNFTLWLRNFIHSYFS